MAPDGLARQPVLAGRGQRPEQRHNAPEQRWQTEGGQRQTGEQTRAACQAEAPQPVIAHGPGAGKAPVSDHDPSHHPPEGVPHSLLEDRITMDQGNLLQMLLLRGLGTTSLVADRLRYVSQEWVSSGRLDPNHASALMEDVLKALRGENPELEQQAERQLERNRDDLLADLGLARQREVDELRGRLDRLERQLRQRGGGWSEAAPQGVDDSDLPPD